LSTTDLCAEYSRSSIPTAYGLKANRNQFIKIETLDQARITAEIARIQSHYASDETQRMRLTDWSPFNEMEVEHRSQQLLSFGSLMRTVGRNDLAGWRILDVGWRTSAAA